jgi:polyhydroxyalkanoate synthesis repressor PhaR
MAAPTLIKKYANRRLYDTDSSRYITLADLEDMIRKGADVTVEDAQSGKDLTQETLTQIILDRGNGRILPTSLLVRLIRLDDEALAEFLTRYVGWSLEVYVQAKQRARSLLPMNPFATAPFAATDALARLVLGASQWGAQPGPPPAGGRGRSADVAPPPPDFSDDAMYGDPPAAVSSVTDEMQRLRRELEELKRSVGGAEPKRKKKARGR